MAKTAERVPEETKRRIIAAIPPVVWRRLRIYIHGESRLQRLWRRARLRQMRRSVGPSVSGELTPIEYQGTRYLAHTVTSFRSGDVLGHHLDLVATCLTAHGIEFAVLD